MMLERFFPDEYVASTYVIPFEKLYEEGYRGVIFDIDNTLVPHGAPADDRAKKLLEGLRILDLLRVFSRTTGKNASKCSIGRLERTILTMRTSLPQRIISGQWNLWGQTGQTQFLWVISFLQMCGERKGRESEVSLSNPYIPKRRFRLF